MRFFQTLSDAVGCPLEVLESEGFEEVIDGIDLETLDSIFGVGSGEDDEGRYGERLDEVHAVEVGHVDVAEDGIDGVVLQVLTGFQCALALGSKFEERHLTDVGDELLER